MVTLVFNDKLTKLRFYLQTEAGQNTSDVQLKRGSLSLEPFTAAVNRPEYKVNVSLDTIEISGLSQFSTSDIATNSKSRKASALLRFPEMRISLYYKVNGVRLEGKDGQVTGSYSDKGKVTYVLQGWRTTLSGKVVDIVNKTRLELAGFGMRSHYDFFEATMDSFGQEKGAIIDISKPIAKDLLKKVINAVDDKLESTLLEHLDVHEMATWANFRDLEYEKEEDGHLLMMESKIHEHSRSNRRQKRQVPCEVGEELDEYVDSLFRFLKRLIRVMEPFNVSALNCAHGDPQPNLCSLSSFPMRLSN